MRCSKKRKMIYTVSFSLLPIVLTEKSFKSSLNLSNLNFRILKGETGSPKLVTLRLPTRRSCQIVSNHLYLVENVSVSEETPLYRFYSLILINLRGLPSPANAMHPWKIEWLFFHQLFPYEVLFRPAKNLH
jgi:hypothetical protein